ncbi:MAG: trehalose-phosphatase [Gammaproteobacteria bacterium]
MTASPALPAWDRRWALFLDVDGTLVDIESHPDEVRAGPGLRKTLARVSAAMGGAVALVSGRSIASLDRIFTPMVLPAAGLHGLERRDADGRVHYPAGFVSRMNDVRDRLARFVESRAGLLLEDKGAALALHFRNAPALEAEAREAMQEAAGVLGDDFHVQQGKMVLELKPSGEDKGTAIRAFMAEPPFAGRIPVFIGDDVTDEDGFRVVNELGGLSMRVGPPETTAARYRVGSVMGVLNQMETWAEEAAEHGN